MRNLVLKPKSKHTSLLSLLRYLNFTEHPTLCGSDRVLILYKKLFHLPNFYSENDSPIRIHKLRIIMLTHFKILPFLRQYTRKSGFGGLGVACWPLVPKFAGSNPAEAVGFLGAKKSSARLPSEGK